MKLRPFELALIIIFIVLGLGALALMATFDGGSGGNDEVAIVGPVQIWGTMPGDGMQTVLQSLASQNDSFLNVDYRYINPADFNNRLVNALADGRGPDIILASHESLVDMRRRIAPYSYDTIARRDIMDLYIDGAQIFALSDGLYGLPIAVDPIVLYWNRDVLATKGFLAPPRTWEELLNVQFGTLIERDFDRTIRRGVIPMGSYTNERNAFGVLSMLIIQGGSAGVTDTQRGYEINLENALAGGSNPVRAAVSFYTRFSQPSNTYYSWNRSFESDRNAFAREELAFYLGYASEATDIERLNPNLNFDIAEVPQGSTASVRRTYGQFYGLSLLRSSDNPAGAYSVMAALNNVQTAAAIATGSGLAPVTRQAVSSGSNDTYGRVAFASAGIAYGWLNPDKQQTDEIFATMTADVNENRRSLDQAITDAIGRLEQVY